MAKILVVDDVAENRDLVATLLQYRGHTVVQAADGIQALEVLREQRPELVVCDILMPTMDGYEFVRRMREDPLVRETQVIFYTATFLEREAQVLAAACGVSQVLTKPCEPEDIFAAVAQALARDDRGEPQAGTQEFDQEHLRLVTDKLVQKADELHHANQRLAALTELSLQLASEHDPELLLDKFCRGVRALFGARVAVLAVKDGQDADRTRVFASGLPPEEMRGWEGFPLDRALAEDLLARRRSRRFSAAGAEQALAQSLAAHFPAARHGVLAPIVSLEHGYGWVLLIDKLGADGFSADDERTLAVQAAQAGRIYENGSLYAKVQQQVAQLQVQAAERERADLLLRLEHAVARALADAPDRLGGLQAVLRIVCESQQWELGRYWQVDEAGDVLRVAAFWSAPEVASAGIDQDVHSLALRRGQGLAGHVWKSGEPLWVPDLLNDPRLVQKAVLRATGAVSASLFPVASEGRLLGVLSFLVRAARAPDDRLQASARVVGNQLGQFLQRKRAEAALLASERFSRSTLDSLVEHVCVLDGAGRIVAVNLAWQRSASGEGGDPLRAPQGENYLVACEQAQDRGARDGQALAAGIRDVLAGRQAVFTIEYGSHEPRPRHWFIARASRFAGEGPVHVVVAHENITERKETEERVRRLQRVSTVLSDINSLIVRVNDRDELFREACRIAVETGRFIKAWIGLIGRDPWRLDIVAGHGDGIDADYFRQAGASMQRHLAEKGFWFEQIVARRQAIVENDVEGSSWMVMRDTAVATGSRALATLPLVVEEQTVGVLVLHAGQAGVFDAQECQLLAELAGDLAFAMDHLAKAEQINRLAYYDALTGHANAMLFNERLAQYLSTAAAGQRSLALAVVDIERFKSINDTLGRHVGDELLRQAADRIAAGAGERSRVARIGPDQFAVVFLDVTTEIEVARMLAEFYQACFGPAFAIGASPLRVAAKIGVALYPGDGTEVEALYRNAEVAARRAKAATERVLFYDARMTESIAEKLALEHRLRDALHDDRFVLHYQPKVDCVSHRVESVEALIRWQDPEFGLVPPAKFIPLMEETGLIVEVGAWALRRAAQERKAWLEQGLAAPRIAVNVSAIQLRRSDFVSMVEAALHLGAATPGIDIEITESVIMEDMEGTIAKLKILRAQGLDIAIDDFGTGYSSLAYLTRLPVQLLKIDRAFISMMLADSDTRTLVATMISLAHALRMKVVAEGVETQEQADLLQLLRCDQLQGYLVSRPLPAAELLAWLGQHGAGA